MVLAFENLMAEYRRAREDHVEEDALCKQLFELVVSL
jgi:predicted NUDIX family phosphoesterase